MEARYELLALLADGRFHSGEALGQALGVGRGAMGKLLHALDDLGIEVQGVRGRGYRLARSIELLNEAEILARLPEGVRRRLDEFTLLLQVDSTNSFLMTRAPRGDAGLSACIAEMQTAGRGRRGRGWVSPFGANLYVSILRRFAAAPENLQGLSLAVGIAVARALESVGATGVQLKWPNDVLLAGSKLGGVLLESVAESGGACQVVAGIGINVDMPPAARSAIDQTWIDLASAGIRPGRNRLAAEVLARVVGTLEHFAEAGFTAFRNDWEALDGMCGRRVVLESAGESLCGRVVGVDGTGALLLEDGGESRRIVSGDISLRVLQ